MGTLEWGQPADAIFQFAYVVEDVERELLRYVELLGVGPWLFRGPFRPTPEHGRYRGGPAEFTLTVARAFSGRSMVELVQQHDDVPSVFHEGDGPRRYGFHHWGRMTSTFDDDVARYAELGYEVAFSDVLGSGARIVYLDARRDLPGFLELVEHNPAQERVYGDVYRAAVDWDGSDPVRRED